eukprot:940585-Prorocentrum_minimum.AAC.1
MPQVPGAEAVDAEDGDVSAWVVRVAGPETVRVPRTPELAKEAGFVSPIVVKYLVEDSAGNIASAAHVIYVVDACARLPAWANDPTAVDPTTVDPTAPVRCCDGTCSLSGVCLSICQLAEEPPEAVSARLFHSLTPSLVHSLTRSLPHSFTPLL